MSIRKHFFSQISVVVSILLLTTIQPLAAESPSDAKRIEELERTVAELKKEVAELKKKETTSVSEGKMKTKISYDGKTYVEKAVVEEAKTPIYVQQRGPELKLVLGGFVQVNFEDGDVSAFEGRFGQTAIKDRFRLRRARINLTGDFAEQFDFKMEGDFGQSDGTSGNRTVNDNNNFMFVGRLELQPFKGKIAGQKSFLKLGGEVLNSRDEQGVNISQSSNLLVNDDGSLSPFVLPSADQRTAWSVDAWLEVGPFDLIGEYLQERVQGRTVNGVPPEFANFTTDGFYVTGAYFLIPKKLQAVVQWQYLNPGQKGNDGLYSILGGLNYYIHGDDLKLMVNYIHTWSDFRQ